MEDATSVPDDAFKFPWEYLAEFYATFRRVNGEKDVVVDYSCCLSRVHLNDKDLVRLSEQKVPEATVDEVTLSIGGMGIDEEEEHNAGSDSPVDDSSEQSGTSGKPPTLTKDAWAELPKRFGSSKLEEVSGHYRKRKRSHEESQKWLRNATFDQYWEEAATYVIYRCWLEDYGSIMNEEDRQQLAQQVEEARPIVLIDEHNDERISKYFGLTKDVKFSTYEELFALHSEFVKKMAEKDFELFRSALTNHRCKTFLKKIQKMGFVPGYGDNDIVTPSGALPSQENEVSKKKEKSHKKRLFSSNYGKGEVLSEVCYDVFDPYAASMSVVLDRTEKPVKVNESSTFVENGEVQESTSNAAAAIGSISFAFDPNNEAYLVAKNAFEYYKDDEEIIKYWYQRYRLFSKLDKGVLMDREGWFSVTPERIAEHIADRIVRRREMLVIDAFAGVGGNSIQLAMKGAQVIAIDLDPVRLKCARENAKVYGVEDKIEFVCCDFFHFASKWTKNLESAREVDAVFLSPPWGGPSYLKSEVFHLDDLTPNGFDIYTAARKMSPDIAYFLPRNTSVKELIALSGSGGRCEIEQSCLNKKIKTLTVYYGNLAVQQED